LTREAIADWVETIEPQPAPLLLEHHVETAIEA